MRISLPSVTRLCAVIIVALATLAGCATVSDVPAADLVGTWRNTDPYTDGITVAEISTRGSGFAVRIWGSCHPEDCDWGTEQIQLFTSSVDESTEAETLSFLATYSSSFSETTVIGRPLASDRMEIQVLTRFTDGSARSNYTAVHELQK